MLNITTVDQTESDHSLVMATRSTKLPVRTPRYREVRDYKSINQLMFQNDLRLSEKIRSSVTLEDPTIATANLIHGIQETLDHHAPSRIVQVRAPTPIDITQQTRGLQYRARTALNTARATGNPEDWRIYRSTHNKATQNLRNDKYNTTKKKFEGRDSRKTWAAVREMNGATKASPPRQLTVQGQLIRKPQEMAQQMNNFFISKIENIRKSFTTSQTDPAEGLKKLVEGKNLNDTLEIHTVSRYELSKIIKSMRPTKSHGIDGISIKLLKDNYSILAPALHNIINQSIKLSIFPNSLKTSRVIPLQKPALPSNQPSSYRPINLLQSISKVIEKVIFTQISKHLEAYSIIPPNHHGSRANH